MRFVKQLAIGSITVVLLAACGGGSEIPLKGHAPRTRSCKSRMLRSFETVHPSHTHVLASGHTLGTK